MRCRGIGGNERSTSGELFSSLVGEDGGEHGQPDRTRNTLDDIVQRAGGAGEGLGVGREEELVAPGLRAPGAIHAPARTCRWNKNQYLSSKRERRCASGSIVSARRSRQHRPHRQRRHSEWCHFGAAGRALPGQRPPDQ